MFNDRYRKLHIGNICTERFADIWRGARYWEVLDHLASEGFNAQKSCGPLCLQHQVNVALDNLKKGTPLKPFEGEVKHMSFI